MSHRLIRWSYLFIVVVCALVVGWSIKQFRDADHVSCENRRQLILNQRMVMLDMIHHQGLDHPFSRAQLIAGLNGLEETPICHP